MYVMYMELLHCKQKPVGKVLLYMHMYNRCYMYHICYMLYSPHICSFPPPLPTKSQFNPTKNKNVIFSCNHFSCTIFVLISYSFETQIMLILILIIVQYSQNAVFSFEEFLNRQNHSSSGSYHLVKKYSQQCSLLFDTKSGKLLKF